MAIPGLKPSFDVRAKVRTGEKRETVKNGRTISFPASTDYFICDEPDFKRVVGDKPKELTVLLPFEKPEDNFSTGLENWQGAMLVCYAKGELLPTPKDAPVGQMVPAAYRKATMKKGGKTVDLLEGFTVLGPTMGQDRRPVHCHVRECAVMKAGECKPMGRLQFFIKGIDPRLGVYQLDTKSWNSVEKMEAFLSVLGDPRGQELTLRVEMWQRGTSKFPVVTLEGGSVVVTEETLSLADALVQLHKAIASSHPDEIKVALAAALDISNPGWRDNPAFIARIKQVGAVAAAQGLLKANEL